jgi:hypothetical protein
MIKHEEIKPKVGLKGWLEIRDNKTKELLLVVPNAILDVGLAAVALLLTNASAEPFLEACVGSGDTAVDVDVDTALETELGTAVATPSRVMTSVANDTAQFVSIHTGGSGGWAIKEYGIKTATGHIMLNRVVFSVINLAEGNELEFTYKVQVQRIA